MTVSKSRKALDTDTRELAAAALRKRQAGGQPTQREVAALRRLEREREEADRWAFYAAVPKAHYLILAGSALKPRPAKVVLDQADRYGLPLRGRTVDLGQVIRAFHDLLAANAHRLAVSDDPDVDPDSPSLERMRSAKADLAEMERDERAGLSLSAERAREIFGAVASPLRRASKRLLKTFGPKAQKILDDALEQSQRHFDRGVSGDPHA